MYVFLSLTHVEMIPPCRFLVEMLDYASASLACATDDGGELLHPDVASEARTLYQSFITGAESPFQVRVDAVQKETCFFETEGDGRFDLSGLTGIDVEEGILDGTDRTAVLDICQVKT